MSTKIGFILDENAPQSEITLPEKADCEIIPQKSLVQIKFPEINKVYTYYNELFDLKIGDFVFVDGKLENTMGMVVNITYNFKIKLSDYQRVISKACRNVNGEFYFAGSHFVSFDPCALPFEQAITWFKAPEKDDEYVCGSDGSSFSFETLDGLDFDNADLEKGNELFMQNSVEYIELNGTKVRAVVVTSKPYIVEFDYNNGEISNLYCGCYHITACRHCFAVLYELRQTLMCIEENYAENFKNSDYFAAILKAKFFSFAIDGKTTGGFNLS